MENIPYDRSFKLLNIDVNPLRLSSNSFFWRGLLLEPDQSMCTSHMPFSMTKLISFSLPPNNVCVTGACVIGSSEPINAFTAATSY